MSKIKFETALTALRGPLDERSLLKVLIVIKGEVEWPKKRENVIFLRDSGALKHLVEVLNAPKNILDVNLSILGNCILDKRCAVDLVSIYHILTPLYQVLKHYSEDDSVNGRIFRIIGNLTSHKNVFVNLVESKPKIIAYVVNTVNVLSQDGNEDKFTTATAVMALRVLRNVLNKDNVLVLTKTFQVLKAVGNYFIKLCAEPKNEHKHKILLEQIIRLVYEYSCYDCYHSIFQMRETDRGNSLNYLNDVLLLFPTRTVRIVKQFRRMSKLMSEVPTREICDKLSVEIEKCVDNKEFKGKCVEYVNSLCHLLQDSITSNEVSDKCVPVLLKLLENLEEPDSKDMEVCYLIFNTLNRCRYDENFIQQQLKCNMIEVLLKKLQHLVKGSENLKRKHKERKMNTNNWFCEEFLPKHISIVNETISPTKKLKTEDWTTVNRYPSPPTCDDFRCRSPSPCSSTDSIPSSSTYPLGNTDSDSDDDYSPVCSEADNTEFPPEKIDEGIFIEPSNQDNVEIEEESNMEDQIQNPPCASIKKKLAHEMVYIVRFYASKKPPIQSLASRDLMLALFKCKSYVSISRLMVAVEQIFKHHENLLVLIRSRVVEYFYDITKCLHENCRDCNDNSLIGNFVVSSMTNLAESAVGQGEINFQLTRGSQEMKEEIVLALPYIIRNNFLLAKFLLKYKALEILLDLFQQENSLQLKERACKTLSCLSLKNLNIKNPVKINSSKIHKVIEIRDVKSERKYKDSVTFTLDDGSSIVADREFLCKQSDFFEGLLRGHFKESKQKSVSLAECEGKSLKCLLQLMRNKNSFDVEIRADLTTLLDAIILSDRFLLVDLCASLTNSIATFNMTSNSVTDIYHWSIESATNILRVESIAYALVADLDDGERLKMFQNLFSLGYNKELIDDIEEMLLRHLKCYVSSSDEEKFRRRKIMNVNNY